MEALILAAGRGTRMKKLTNRRPKCFNLLANQSLLQWQLKALAQAGLRHPFIVTGYCKEAFDHLPYRLLYNSNWKQTNMVCSLRCAAQVLKTEPCIISYSDIVFHPSIIECLKQADGDIVISYDVAWKALWQQRFKDPLEDAESFKLANNRLCTIGEKASSLDQIEGQYMGLLKITPAGWSQIQEVLFAMDQSHLFKLDMTALLRLLLSQQIPIGVVPTVGRWCEVDSEHDLNVYHHLLTDPNWTHNWMWKEQLDSLE